MYEETMKKLIEKAKRVVVRRYEGKDETSRAWLRASPPDSYEEDNYRVELWVLEGSPPKGYVLASHGIGQVKAFDWSLRCIKTYDASEVRG
ncbi:MAG: hypothetical protein SBU_000102 [Candidatus Syntrophoarchaeum butanivorans]|uniref:Uncharacterized protein n=1 Tax=Candidatus Syntropharchaeum butanivorans TaxID=1839936 RepID=A0A1F2P657_9EURY|nr:MAG: hypothetical protein SBU_000102 [Candidatus Syntrophoarchaeum butanivorans]